MALQVGFNRRFDAEFAGGPRALVAERALGDVAAAAVADPRPRAWRTRPRVPPWTIFTQTLIHDFDTLRWLNPGAEPVEVYATADALVAPEFKDAGLLDTAVVVITFDNGARAVAEASFSAAYGYDVRGEVFGSRRHGHVGDGAPSSARLLHRRGPARTRPPAATSS